MSNHQAWLELLDKGQAKTLEQHEQYFHGGVYVPESSMQGALWASQELVYASAYATWGYDEQAMLPKTPCLIAIQAKKALRVCDMSGFLDTYDAKLGHVSAFKEIYQGVWTHGQVANDLPPLLKMLDYHALRVAEREYFIVDVPGDWHMTYLASNTEQVILQRVQCVARQYPTIDKIMLFGSRAKGEAISHSDFDLVVVGDLNHAMWIKIKEAFIGLSMLKLDVHHWQAMSETFQQEVLTSGKVIYDAI